MSRSSLVQHLLKADGGDLLVVAVPLELDPDAADELPDSDGRQPAPTSRDAAGDSGDERGSQAQLGSRTGTESVTKLDLSRLHARGTIARVRQLTWLAEVQPLPCRTDQYNRCLLQWCHCNPRMSTRQLSAGCCPEITYAYAADDNRHAAAADWRVGAGT